IATGDGRARLRAGGPETGQLGFLEVGLGAAGTRWEGFDELLVEGMGGHGLPPVAGEQPGLVSAPVQRQARFVDELTFTHQSADLVSIAGTFGLPLGGLVVVAAIAQL